MKCRSPNCPSARFEGSRFCEFHRDLLASVATEIDKGKTSRRRSPDRQRRTMFKECDWVGLYGGAPRRVSPTARRT